MRRIVIAAALAATPFCVHAQETSARSMAAGCAICHGTDGRAVTKDVAPLAGLPREHIAGQLRAFRDGNRQATVMHQIAKGYTDAQIDALAAWFSAQRRQP